MSTPYVAPTLEGRVMVELGATLAKVRREVDAALDRCDTLAQQLAAAHAALRDAGVPLPGPTLSEDVSGHTNPRGADDRASQRPVGVSVDAVAEPLCDHA